MAARNKARPRIQLPAVGETPTHEVNNGSQMRRGVQISPSVPQEAGYPLLTPGSLLQLQQMQQQQPPTPGLSLPPGTAAVDGHGMPFFYGKQGQLVYAKFHQQIRGVKDFTLNYAKSGLSLGEKTAFLLYNKISHWSKRWFTHLLIFGVVFAYSLLGAAIFVAIEGPHEQKHRVDILREKTSLLADLRVLAQKSNSAESGGSVAEREETWTRQATQRLAVFTDQLYDSYSEAHVKDTPKEIWNFWNAVFYCGTIYTTIGYGHIVPSTNTGRAMTIVYAVFGIPLFLILLADFGKLFTRCLKFLWAFVRRLYFTGSCRKVRHTVPVQGVFKGARMVYDIARFQRHPLDGATAAAPVAPVAQEDKDAEAEAGTLLQPPLEPETPAPSNFSVDDEFNLPISVAIFLLVSYIFVGALLYSLWEDWSFFESFYFVFVSMSTIGFGDYVPKHPMFMMGSIVYLIFGLALTSMCINVVQVMLSDTFRQASSKIGASLGLRLAAGSTAPGTAAATPAAELVEVHLPANLRPGVATSPSTPAAVKASQETLGDDATS